MPFVHEDDERFMREAAVEATLAGAAGEVPVGACVVCDGVVIARARNAMQADVDATQHAELRALREAMQVRGTERLGGCTLYVTLEPCAMCAGAVVLSRVDRVVFGAWDAKAGMAGSIVDLLRHSRLNHRPEVLGGVLATESQERLSSFFSARRRSVTQGSSVDSGAPGQLE